MFNYLNNYALHKNQIKHLRVSWSRTMASLNENHQSRVLATI